jgi:hypothetical protein
MSSIERHEKFVWIELLSISSHAVQLVDVNSGDISVHVKRNFTAAATAAVFISPAIANYKTTEPSNRKFL